MSGKQRAAYGSGSVFKEKQASGKVVWIGQARVAGRQRQRTLGPASGPDALSTRQARRALDEVRAAWETEAVREATTRPSGTLRTVAEAHLAQIDGEVRATTLKDYRGYLEGHLLPFSGDVRLSEIRVRDVEDFIHHQRTKAKQRRLDEHGKQRVGLAGSTIANQVNYLHAIFAFAQRREEVTVNPVAPARKPKVQKQDADFSYLSVAQVDAVVRAVVDDYLGQTDRTLILTAAHTGLRQGELIALRWSDVLWTQSSIRVRASVSRGVLGDPKSQTSRREVPMGDRVARALELHHQATEYGEDDHHVFCHPHTGRPYDPSKLRDRFYDAMKAAGLGAMLGRDKAGSSSTRCATRSAPRWPHPARRSSRSRSGWATRTSRRR